MRGAALGLLLLLPLLLTTPARAAFVDGVEHFDGNTLDLSTWTVGDYGDGFVTQSGVLRVDFYQEYFTTAAVGYPVKVSVDVLSATGTARLFLGSRARPHLPMFYDYYAASIGYDRANRCFHATIGGGANQDSLILGYGQIEPPTPAAPYRIELERPDRVTMIYRAYRSTGELVAEVARSFRPVLYPGVDVPLHVGLGTCCSGSSTFDEVRMPLASPCGNGTTDPGEQCDDGNTSDGDCCSSTCGLALSGTVCRAAGDECDLVETCSGESGLCPADAFAAGGMACADDGDACTSDACDGSGACVHAPLSDGDGDTICDARDACTNVQGGRDFATTPRSLTRLGRVNEDPTPGNETLALRASFALPAERAFADLDLRLQGARILLRSAHGGEIVDVALPGGAYAGRGTRGWRASPQKTSWQYLDHTRTPLAGITKVKVIDRGASRPGGTVAVEVSGRRGSYPIAVADVPVDVSLVLGGQGAAILGMCAESAYASTDCAFNARSDRLTCQR